MRVHLLGIGGAGVSALARIFLARGDEVSGCDERESATTRELAFRGAEVAIGHDPAHVAGQDLVVYTGAVRAGQGELDAARAGGARVLSRAECLAELISQSDSIAVAGTHGKTTLTFMLGHLLTQAGWDPSVLVGDGTSSRAGRSRWLVAEADESDGSLALHRPQHGMLTNVEFDHPDHFAGLAEVERLFADYLLRIPGLAVVCADDQTARSLPAGGTRVTYGFAADASYRCEAAGEQMFHVLHRGRRTPVRLQVPGRHNVQNATGAMAMAVELGVDAEVAAGALATFPGAHRRLERLGTWRGAELYDDYGHHPTEVEVTLDAARELAPGRRLVLVFQPHRFSRYIALKEGFAHSLARADELVVTEIYAAGEENPGGVTARGLAERVPGASFAPDLGSVRQQLEGSVRAGDLVLFMGAGDVWKLGDELAHSA